MSPHATILAPSLLPSSIVHIDFSPSLKGKQVRRPVVREYDFECHRDGDDEWEDIGHVKKIAVGSVGGERKLAIADSNYLLSLTTLPTRPFPSFPRMDENGVTVLDGSASASNVDDDDAEERNDQVEDEQEQDELEPLIVEKQFKVKPGRKGDSWVGLDVLSTGILSTLSSGTLNHSSTSTSTSEPTRTTHLPSGIRAVRSIRSRADDDGEQQDPTLIALAGKDVEISLWDVERTLAGSATSGNAMGGPAEGKKRKKGNGKEMGVGEVWRARNMPNNNLSVPTPIHHTCIAQLSTSYGSTSQPGLVSGTKSGHVRRYDTRQRRCVAEWKVGREGGIGQVEVGEGEHELFFADRSALLGALDLRTGRVLYTYTKQTSTPLSLLPLRHGKGTTSLEDRVGMITLSSDATVRLHTTSGVPKDGKGNVRKGEIVTSVGGMGTGELCWLGWEEVEEEDEDEVMGASGDVDEDEVEDVWDEMGVVGEDDASESQDEEEEEEQVKVVKKRKGKATKA